MEQASASASGINYGSQVYHNYGQITNNYVPQELAQVIERLDQLLPELLHQKEERLKRECQSQTPKFFLGSLVGEYLARLQYERSLMPEDCKQLLKMRFNLQSLAHNRLQTLIHHPMVQSWLQTNIHPVVLINGTSSPLAQSETSFFAAKLVHSMRTTLRVRDDMVIAFFCGQHRDLEDVHSSPSEFIMSLYSQLVEAYQAMSPAELHACMAGLVPTETASIYRAFERLVGIIEEGFRLFIIVDGLEFFAEPQDRAEEMATLVRQLRALCKSPLKATVKLLFTTPSRAAFVQELFSENEVVNLPRHCRPGSMTH